VSAALALALALAAPAADAASLVQVTGFGTNPTNLAMHLYVPDNVAARPGLLLALHYCTGTGPAFFSGTEFRALADRHGFIVIYPSATRSGQCWDVSSPAALRRDGGSDPVGLRSMISYVQSRYAVDPSRIFVTGASSGGMMTNVMLGVYPDVFKAGASYMGVPFGCFATTDGSSWNSQCSSGQRILTPQQWGDLVRAAYPGYTGARPRMQAIHGTTDSTLHYANFGEQIKQWTNVLGVSQTPSLTDSAGSCTRTRYGGTGVQAPVEGISCAGVGHSVPLAGQAALTIAFFGLDQAGPGPGTSYSLAVTRAGTGSGAVAGGPISCGATCAATIASGTAVTLAATPAAGSAFAGWGGACTGSGPCVVTMTADRAVTATFTATAPTGAVSINAGGAAAGSFAADAYFTGGNTYSTTSAIDTSLLSGTVPPQAVFQTERYGAFTYTIPNLAPGSAQTVTLYFQESYWTAAGQRVFDVAINGTTVLSAFDIYAAAGGRYRAIARSFNATASANGQVFIQFTRNGPDQPKLCGITVAAGQTDPDPDPDPTTHTLTVSRAGTGSGTVTGSGISCGTTCTAAYASGTSVTLTAAAASGSTFAGWSGACTGTAATCVVAMTAAHIAGATFTASTGTACRTATGGNSGNFDTTGAVCFTVGTRISGWGCSNMQGRTVTVNGAAVTCSQLPLPGAAPYTFEFSAGSYPWASFYWW